MKANRKFIENKEAVSAVIGVILMVAITVAMVGILWGYLSGFFTGPTTKYTITAALLTKDTTAHSATYTIEDVSDDGIEWSKITANCVASDGTVTTGTLSHSPATDTTVKVGQTFTVDVGTSAWTGTLKLIYDNDQVLWTSPTITV
jgi:FlaG/FlaF family flagellin (archaellin)